jgi:hypothetical protein
VDNLQVDGEFFALIVDNQDADTATAILEGLLEAVPEVGLIKYREGLLDITGLSHGNDSVILEIENTVLLEDGTQHGLNDDAWAWVGDE